MSYPFGERHTHQIYPLSTLSSLTMLPRKPSHYPDLPTQAFLDPLQSTTHSISHGFASKAHSYISKHTNAQATAISHAHTQSSSLIHYTNAFSTRTHKQRARGASWAHPFTSKHTHTHNNKHASINGKLKLIYTMLRERLREIER